MKKNNIYQIYYNQETRALLDPGFIPLENTGNPRPDWREYWPIRNFLLSGSLKEDELYGFLSPAFHYKTRLQAGKMNAFINANPGFDVYSFSPLRQDSLCYLNIFEHGNRYHPGLILLTHDFLLSMGKQVNLVTMVTDLRNTIFCNYFVATPRFWRKWFAITEQLFALVEDRNSVLGQKIDAYTDYRFKGPLNMKVFIVERIASMLLTLEPSLSTIAYDIETMPWTNTAFLDRWDDMMTCNALKMAYAQTGNQRYLKNFFVLRNAILRSCDVMEEEDQNKIHFF